jgi:signal recognition particle receptor subunit alpha
MLEELLIFTRGGLILWSSCRALGVSAALKGSPIDALVRSCLLEERSADASFQQDTYALKWTFSNDLGLVFVAVYQRMLHLLYVEDLLAAVRREFSQIYDPKRVSYDDVFTDVFRQLHLEAEARAEAMKKTRQQNTLPSSRAPAAGGKKPGAGGRGGPQGAGTAGGKKGGGAESGKDDSDGSDSGKEQSKLTNGTVKKSIQNGVSNARAAVVVDNGKENGDPNDGAFDVNTLRKKIGKKNGKKSDLATKKVVAKAEPKKNVKKDRVWDDQPRKAGKLDFTDPADERGDEAIEQAIAHQGDSMMDKDEVLSSDSEDEDEEGEENAEAGQKKKGWFTSMFKR